MAKPRRKPPFFALAFILCFLLVGYEGAAQDIPYTNLLTGLEYPKGLWVDGTGVYLTETAGRNTVWGGRVSLNRYDTLTDQNTVLILNPVASDAVVVTSDGRIYLTSYVNSVPGESGVVTVVDPANGYTETTLLDIEIASENMYVDSDDNILIIGSSDEAGAKSIYLLPVGAYSSPIILKTGLGRTWAISMQGGTVYCSIHSPDPETISRFSFPSGPTEVFKSYSQSGVPMSISLTSQYLYYASYFGGTVGRIDLQTSNDETLISGLNHPIAIRYDSGKIYFLETGTEGNQYKDGTLNVAVVSGGNTPPAAADLRTNGAVNPNNASDYTPRLSWSFSDADNGDSQGAYQIRVGSTQGGNDLWDQTGTTESGVEYAGAALPPNTTVYWSVRVQDQAGSYSGWAEATLVVLDIGLRVFDGNETIRIGVDYVNPSYSLRIYKNGTTYGIILVDPSDPDASSLRIQTPSGIKALKRM